MTVRPLFKLRIGLRMPRIRALFAGSIWLPTVTLLFFGSCLACTPGCASKDPAPKAILKLDASTNPISGAEFEVLQVSPEVLIRLAAAKWDEERFHKLFRVQVVNPQGGEQSDQLSLLGAYRVEADRIRFKPKYPLQVGIRYRAIFDPNQLPGNAGAEKAIEMEAFFPKPENRSPSIITAVYPTAKNVPENLLRCYFQFSAPMSRGESYRHIHLLNSAGKEIELPFLELDEELWNPEGTRFTLLFDPGRIKRGLKPREEVGPVFEEGKSYSLVIDSSWLDAKGNPVKEAFRREFVAGPPDDTPIDPQKWKIVSPRSGSTDPLLIEFGKPLDHALATRLLSVFAVDSKPIAGKADLIKDETCWRFIPSQGWRPGEYQIRIETSLEDVAGNRIGRPFEIDVFKKIELKPESGSVSLPIHIAGDGPK